MARLPRQYAPLVYGIIQAAIMTAVATAIATPHLTDFSMRFVEEWSLAWALAFLTMLPVVVFVSPFIQRCVLALTVPTGDSVH
jgi:ABC-type glycerol-3-phosphate transport system permease component